MATQFGYFLIADITGYTQYLSASELDHAQQTLTALLNLLIKHTKPPLVISRLAGDAVISYGLRDSFCSGQTFVEMLEDTYLSFRRQVELMVRNTTCPCNACRNIGTLDLKFFVHSGEFGVQRLDAHDELVGSDVNLIHRLLKNHVTEATGLRAYTLYSDAAVQALGLGEGLSEMTRLVETYEHLGDVVVWVKDMHPLWEARRAQMQDRIAAEDELLRISVEIAAPVEAVWNAIVEPDHFNVLLGGDRMVVAKRAGGRVAPGSIYQCYHGEQHISNVVTGWQPFESVVMEFVVPMPLGAPTMRAEVRLTPCPGGTQAIEIMSKASGALVARLAADAGMKARLGYLQQHLEAFKAHVEAMARASEAALPPAAAPAEASVAAAARAALEEV